MGVKGLTTYLKENRRQLSHTLELKTEEHLNDGLPKTEEHSRSINIVVDGWSLIYAVYNNSGEPWVYGGENASLVRHVESVVSAWRRAGLRPTFVFDGPTPPLKYPTLVSRLQNNCVKQANLFFRTSAAARSTPRSLAETRIAPTLGYPAIISALLSLGDDVKLELADGEADPYIVALAGRLGAYVTGKDSDFIVLNCDGYKGYIPLDEMIWSSSVVDHGVHSPSPSLVDGDNSEFQTVTKKKQKGKIKTKESQIELGTGPLPPSSPLDSDLSLLVTVYEPVTFAKHVSLPPSLLPLLGALIGNDYASFDFFRSTESMVQRVQRVADTLSSVLKEAQSGNAKKIRKIDRGGQGSVMDVIGTTVERLLLWRDPRYPPASGQIDKITETVVQSTLEYAMDAPGLLHQAEEDEGSHSLDSRSQGIEDVAERVRTVYLHAYHRGTFHPRLIEVFSRGSCFPALFLEDPDRECCARSIGRPVREVIWSIFSDGGGIPERPELVAENEKQIETDLMEDEDELVDVVEELSDDDVSVEEDDEDDPLAALRGKLQRISFSGVGAEAPEAADLSRPETVSHTPTSYVEVPKRLPRSKVVTEYVRRGARVAAEELQVTGLDDGSETTTPPQLRPVEDRLRVFLRSLGSDTHSVRAVATDESESRPHASRGGKLLLVVTLRWVLQTLHARAEAAEDGSRRREREMEKWTRSEARAFLTCCLPEEETLEMPSIEDRAVQLTAQALAAFEACGWLAQALLLVDLPDSCGNKDGSLPMVIGQAEKMFSGRRFHTALARPRQCSGEVFQQLWRATEEGLEGAFREEKGRRGRKDRKERSRTGGHTNGRGGKPQGAGMFGVLAGLGVQ